MTTVTIDAGTLAFSEEDMTATGLLVPFGVKARSNLGEFTVDSGVFTLPADTTGASLNIEHQREDVAGGIARAWEQPEGILGTFKFADTDEGRQAFADAKSGKRKNLSAEVAGVRIKDGKATSGRLFAAALVEKPAFAGATLLAAEDTGESEPTDNAPTDAVHMKIGIPDENFPEDITLTPPTGEARTYTPEAEAPAQDNPEGGSTVTATATQPGQTPATAAAPDTLLAGNTTPAETEVNLGTVFAAMATVKASPSNMSADAQTLLAALSDIKTSGTGALAGTGVLQPAWVGKLWQGKRYQRKYLDLFTHLYGGIQLGGRKGFKLDQGTALVTHWAGNKAAIGSGTATTSTTASSLQPYGYAADVAREWYDLEGGAEVIQAFFEGVVDSYAKLTDEDALAAVFAAAAGTSLANLVAPGTFPGVDGHDYPDSMGMVIQAIEAISDADDDAASVVVNPKAWNELLYTPKELIPEYVSFSVTAGSGEANADGKVLIKKAKDDFFPGLDATKPAVLGGAKNAVEFREQGTTPIQIDALDIARGGIDKAVIGYLETFVVRPESLVLIGTKSA
jgi:hypothetical protein